MTVFASFTARFHKICSPLRILCRMLVVAICLAFALTITCQSRAQAQSNRPPQVTPVEDREMYVDDLIQISLRATDPNDDDTVTFMELPSVAPFPEGATLYATGDGSGYIEFAPRAAGDYAFAVVAVDDGTPQGRTALLFNVTVKEMPTAYADLAITNATVQSTAADGEVHRGLPFSYLVDVTNETSATLPAADTVVTIILKRYLILQDSNDECVVELPSIEDTRLICTFGELAPGASRRIQLSLRARDEGFTTIQTLAETTTLDPITVNDDISMSFEVLPPLTDLAVINQLLTKPVIDTFDVGEFIRFQVTVKNEANVSANFVLTDTFSAGIAIVDIETGGSSACRVRGQQIFCDGALAAQSAILYTINAQIVGAKEQNAVATVTANYVDPDESNNRATAQLTAEKALDLRVTIETPKFTDVYEVGDFITSDINVESITTTIPMTIEMATVVISIPSGLALLTAITPPDLSCLSTQISLVCEKRLLRTGESFRLRLVFYAKAIGEWNERAFVAGRLYRETDINNNDRTTPILVVERTASWAVIHTFYDTNGNGKQDPGEPSAPGVEIDISSEDSEETAVDRGSTDASGLLKQPILEDASKIKLRARLTATQGITPVVSVKLNNVPPTGEATIAGSASCGMTVTDDTGTVITLPCSEKNQLAWLNQINASVADFAAKLSLPPLSAAKADDPSTQPIEVTFEITALESRMIFLPVITK